ncbi:scoloptoxin SSD14-like isoform X2 [Ornithodoros turicata]|uniref:scoloptoxin SSD14-like isoform X2 n=1 Tax=Ornithodoros turicata TaxID=34597 RepID=UPI0031391B45
MQVYEPMTVTARPEHGCDSVTTYECKPGCSEDQAYTRRVLHICNGRPPTWEVRERPFVHVGRPTPRRSSFLSRLGRCKMKLWPLKSSTSIKLLTILGVLLVVCMCAAVIRVYVLLEVTCENCIEYTPFVSPSALGVYKRWATSTDAAPCSAVPKRIFAKNGTLADAAVATMLCMGVVLPHSMGIGGGFLATVYERNTKKSWSLIARERAPSAAKKTMFVGQPSASVKGGKAVGVPGELRGYQALLERMGSNLPWKDLFEDAIKLARDGFPVQFHLSNAMNMKKEAIYENLNMRKVYWNTTSNDTLKDGALLFQKDLADTLQDIAENGADYFYNGEFAEALVEEVQEQGGILTVNDLKDYKAEWLNPIMVKFMDGRTLYSTPPPGSGIVLAYLLKIIESYKNAPNAFLDDNVLTLHRFAEACKFAYAQRAHLGDSLFVDIKDLLENMTSTWLPEQSKGRISDSQTFSDPRHYDGNQKFTEDHGTAHASFWGPNGDAIAISSTVNYYFGSLVRTSRGVVLNNQMDDFSTPGFSNTYGIAPSMSNFIQPGKRPMSSMAPAIFVNPYGSVDLVLGGAGGAKITSSIALVSMKNLWQGYSIKEAIDFPRLHHQLIPNILDVEKSFPQAYVERLKARGHHVNRPKGRFSIIMGISRYQDRIHANADYRKGGAVDGE